MPAFYRLLALSTLALAVSVQATPLGTVESRELSHVSHSAEPDVMPDYDDGEAGGLERRHDGARKHRKGKGKGSRRPASTNPSPSARNYEENVEEEILEARDFADLD